MNKTILGGLLFALIGLTFLVLKANNVAYLEVSLIGIAGIFLLYKIRQRQKEIVSKRSANISIILCAVGILLFALNNTYAYSFIGFALISDIIFPLIFKKK